VSGGGVLVTTLTTSCRRRLSRGKKEIGIIGQASWISSVINLVNTSRKLPCSFVCVSDAKYSRRRRCPCHASGPLAHGNTFGDLRHHLGRIDGGFRVVSSDAMRKVSRQGLSFILCPFSDYLPERGSYLWRCHSYQMLRGRCQLSDYYWWSYAWGGQRFQRRCWGTGVSFTASLLGDRIHVSLIWGPLITCRYSFCMTGNWQSLFSRLIVIPLSFLRRLDSLKYTSVIALISIGYLVILVVAHFIKGDTMQDRGAIRVIRWGGAIPTLSSFPVMVFAYTCHQNVSDILPQTQIQRFGSWEYWFNIDVFHSERDRDQDQRKLALPHNQRSFREYRCSRSDIHSSSHNWISLFR